MTHVFDSDAYDVWIRRERKPTSNDILVNHPGRRADYQSYLVIPREDGRNALGRRIGCGSPCGTEAKATWHRKHGEPVDRPCLDAENAARTRRRHERREHNGDLLH